MKNKFIIFCIFLCSLILIFSISFTVYSKYKNSLNLLTKTEIAKPIFELVKSDVKEIEVLNNDKYSYEFSVRNFNQKDEVSDVNFKYNIEFVLTQENAPVKINLYRINNSNEEKVELNNNKTIQYENLNFNKNANLYRAEIMYDNSSDVILENNFGISLNIQGIQEKEENIEQ